MRCAIEHTKRFPAQRISAQCMCERATTQRFRLVGGKDFCRRAFVMHLDACGANAARRGALHRCAHYRVTITSAQSFSHHFPPSSSCQLGSSWVSAHRPAVHGRFMRTSAVSWDDSCVYRVVYYRAMLCIRGTSHGPVSVRPSVCPSVRHKPVFY